ncbi:phage baseplate assembly protein V [Streptomyces sp. NPDC056512]|uniref:phage baseplate assembly protein V n=1 Tax=Streptomyces sp. NPDC056512 TaxID=3345846 RepID=UPI0036B002AF
MELERTVAGLVEKTERRYYGKYRGSVVDNRDPSRLGRVRVSVPSVLGPDVATGWATPCLPYGGAADQGFLFVPERDAGVWVEFEEGDLEFPIWVGTYWTRPESKSQLPTPQGADGSPRTEVQDPPTRKIIKTSKGHTIQFEDADGEESVLVREGRHGHRITMDGKGLALVDERSNTIVFDENGIEVTDETGNSIRMTDSAMTLVDHRNNTVELSAAGIELTDTTGNSLRMTDTAMTLRSTVSFSIDASGQKVTIVADGIDLKKG